MSSKPVASICVSYIINWRAVWGAPRPGVKGGAQGAWSAHLGLCSFQKFELFSYPVRSPLLPVTFWLQSWHWCLILLFYWRRPPSPFFTVCFCFFILSNRNVSSLSSQKCGYLMCSAVHGTDAPVGPFIDFEEHELTKSIGLTGFLKKPPYLLIARKYTFLFFWSCIYEIRILLIWQMFL